MGGSRGGHTVGGFPTAHLGNLKTLIQFIHGSGSEIDADMVDGLHASDLVKQTDVVASPSANKILRMDGNGKLPGDITGNAGGAGRTYSRGAVAMETGTTLPAVSGMTMTEAYRNGHPITYGNVLNLHGTGQGQLLIGWSGTSAIDGTTAGNHESSYIRSKRDSDKSTWSPWAKIWTDANHGTGSGLSADNVRGYTPVNKAGDSMTGSLTVGGSGELLVTNPGNASALVSLSWLNNAPRIRVSGSGNGAEAEFTIQGPGDIVRFGVDNSGNGRFKGGLKIGAGNLDMDGSAILNMGSIETAKGNILKTGDSWLRINETNAHSSGVYFGTSVLRTDGTLHVGNVGATLYVNNYSFAYKGEAATFKSTRNFSQYFRITDSSDAIIFNVDTTNNRVGINTGSPTSTLQVNGDIYANNTISSVTDVGNVVNFKLRSLQTRGGYDGSSMMWMQQADNYATGTGVNINLADNSIAYMYTCDRTGVYLDRAKSWKSGYVSPYNVQVLLSTSDFIYFGDYSTFNQIYFHLATKAVGATLVFEYWNGTAWATLSVTDNTAKFTKNEWINWSSPSNWAKTTVNDISAYWMRIKSTTLPTTIPVVQYADESLFTGNPFYMSNSGVEIFKIDAAGKVTTGGDLIVGGTIKMSGGAADVITNLNYSSIMDSRYAKSSGQQFSGNVSFNGHDKGISLTYLSSVLTPTVWSSGAAITGGSDYAGLDKLNNVAVQTWFGFSVSNTIDGQPIAKGKPAFSVNARTGDVYAYGYNTVSSQWWTSAGTYGMNMSNSDIIGLNNLFWADECEADSEGLQFPKTGKAGSRNVSDYDTVRAIDGRFLFNGNEIDYVVSSGFNANGNFVRYSSGLQICWLRTEGTANSYSWLQTASSAGNYWYTNMSWTFPAAFHNNGKTYLGLFASGDVPGANMESFQLYFKDYTYAMGEAGVLSQNAPNAGTLARTFMAIGHWK